MLAENMNPRSRDTANVSGDVGYNGPCNRRLFDHHQPEFQGTYKDFGIRLSSAGLVFK